MTQEQIELMANGPQNADETKKAAFRQMTSAFRFAYTAWEFAALGKSVMSVGGLAASALVNVDEACRILNCNEFVMTDKMQDVSDWLEERGMPGIRALVRSDDNHVDVVAKSAGRLVTEMKAYREAARRLAAERAAAATR